MGFTIELKADVVSVVAIALSLFAASIPLVNLFTGAETNIVLPDTVTVYSQSYNVGAEDFQAPAPFIEFAFPLLAYNDGAPDSTVLIKSVELQVEYAGVTKQYDPALFGRTLNVHSSGEDCVPDGERIVHAKAECLFVFDEGVFRPMVIKRDDVVQQEIIFIPHYNPNCTDDACFFQNYLWTDDVLAGLQKKQKGSPSDDIELRLKFDVPNDGFGGRTVEITCKLSHIDLEKVFPGLWWMSASSCQFS